MSNQSSAVRVQDLKITGRVKLHNGEKPFVFLAYVAGMLLIDTFVDGAIVTLEIAFNSVALKKWNSGGLDVSFPSSKYVDSNGVEQFTGVLYLLSPCTTRTCIYSSDTIIRYRDRYVKYLPLSIVHSSHIN